MENPAQPVVSNVTIIEYRVVQRTTAPDHMIEKIVNRFKHEIELQYGAAVEVSVEVVTSPADRVVRRLVVCGPDAELLRQIDEGFDRIAKAREAAGVKPGEPLLGLPDPRCSNCERPVPPLSQHACIPYDQILREQAEMRRQAGL